MSVSASISYPQILGKAIGFRNKFDIKANIDVVEEVDEVRYGVCYIDGPYNFIGIRFNNRGDFVAIKKNECLGIAIAGVETKIKGVFTPVANIRTPRIGVHRLWIEIVYRVDEEEKKVLEQEIEFIALPSWQAMITGLFLGASGYYFSGGGRTGSVIGVGSMVMGSILTDMVIASSERYKVE